LAHPFKKPVLVFCDVYCFGPLKKPAASKGFATDADVKQVITSWLQTLDTDFLYAGIQALAPQWERCVNENSDYVEV